MSFHFVSHRWEVQDVDGGTQVMLTQRDLESAKIPVLVDELFDLCLEGGQGVLFLDFRGVHLLASIVVGKLLALNARLRQSDCRLVLCNVEPTIHEMLQNTGVADVLEVRCAEMAGDVLQSTR